MNAQQKKIRRRVIIGLILILCISYIVYALTEPLTISQPIARFSFSQSAKPVSIAWPNYGESAVSAVGYNLLATHGSQTPLPTASVAKIVTALAVLKKAPLVINQSGPIITLNQTDVDAYNSYLAEDGSVVKVAVGEKISEYQALEAMLMPSANNIAETLANWAFGSVDAYNTYANTYVNQLGMTNTTITDPSGFLPTTVSTPQDLITLGKAALSNPVITQIINQKSATIPVQGVINNVNLLLGDKGIVGIKTGDNDQDLGCFLFAANQVVGSQTIRIVGVIMGGPNLGTTMWDALPLISNVANSFTNLTVINTDDGIATYTTQWGTQTTAVASRTLSTLVWNGSDTTSSVTLEKLQVPLAAGSQVGTLSVKNSLTNEVSSIPIILKQPIIEPSVFWRLTHSF